MKKFIFQIAILIIILFLALALATGKISDVPFIPEPIRQGEIAINGNRLKVEIADTQSKRSKGLGGRESLATDSGMLFVFSQEDKYAFWMKGLKFPLDIVWIRQQKVVDIIRSAQPPRPDQKDEDLPIYLPNQPVDMVLEVNAGTVDSLDITIGDTISIIR